MYRNLRSEPIKPVPTRKTRVLFDSTKPGRPLPYFGRGCQPAYTPYHPAPAPISDMQWWASQAFEIDRLDGIVDLTDLADELAGDVYDGIRWADDTDPTSDIEAFVRWQRETVQEPLWDADTVDDVREMEHRWEERLRAIAG